MKKYVCAVLHIRSKMKILQKFIFIFCIFIFLSYSSKKDVLKISFFNVNQGDSSFINYKNVSIIAYTGESAFTDDVVKSIKSKNISFIDYVILTHDHSCHSICIFENLRKL